MKYHAWNLGTGPILTWCRNNDIEILGLSYIHGKFFLVLFHMYHIHIYICAHTYIHTYIHIYTVYSSFGTSIRATHPCDPRRFHGRAEFSGPGAAAAAALGSAGESGERVTWRWAWLGEDGKDMKRSAENWSAVFFGIFFWVKLDKWHFGRVGTDRYLSEARWKIWGIEPELLVPAFATPRIHDLVIFSGRETH